MSDDFGTVNVKRGDRAREIEVLRGRYRTHRESLLRLIDDAPTDVLAAEYRRLIGTIDDSLRKLDELEGRAPAADLIDTQRARATSPGMRPLAATTPPPPQPVAEPVSTGRYVEPPPAANSGSRMLLIIAGGVVVLAIIGWLIWHASSDRHAKPITETTVTTATSATGTEPPVTPAPTTSTPTTASSGALKLTPVLVDFGVVRKGTRQVRQVDVTNGGTAPITLEVARSACRCLFYEYEGKLPLAAGKKETITVVVDGAKAKPGAIEEQIAVTAKGDPSISATFTVRAVVK